MNYLFLIQLAGVIVVLIVFFVRIEHRLTHIEVDLTWIKKIVGSIGCNVNSKGKEK